MSEFDLVVLQDDTANERLKTGDIGTILTVYNDGRAFEPGHRCGGDAVAASDQNGEGVGSYGRSGYDNREGDQLIKF